MDYRRIGSLSASVVGLGCNQFGTAACDEATATAVIHEALDAGITYFDTADEYGLDYTDMANPAGWGASEKIVGRALAGRRDEVVIATKFGAHEGNLPGRGGTSARWLAIALEDSLTRLQTDHIDLYQIHRGDGVTPVEETVAALGVAVASGKVREVGFCNYVGEEFLALVAAAHQAGLHFVSDQDQLNLLRRNRADDVLRLCRSYDLAFIPYFPLASGRLTGKYQRGQAIPAGSRLADQMTDDERERALSDKTFDRIEALTAFAAEHGHTLLELAFGWLLGLDPVATVISGAARPGQARANAAASGWRMTPDEVAAATRAVEAVG